MSTRELPATRAGDADRSDGTIRMSRAHRTANLIGFALTGSLTGGLTGML
ncbi:MAG: hypothetical protein H0U79_07155 [Solirubrobacterales bacterium]|nr:hypothetical protein [Solirubrobacterales bacterium]